LQRERRRILLGAAIAIDGERIASVGELATLRVAHPDAEEFDGHGMVAIPGLIDTHAHADQSLLRGLGDAMHWHPFLDHVISPYLAIRDPADGVLANTLSMIEMIRGGTTCFVSPNADPRDDYAALSSAVADTGICAIFYRFIQAKERDFSAMAAKTVVADAGKAMALWHGGAGGRVSLWFGLDVPRRPGHLVYPEFYKEVAADTYGVRPAEWSRSSRARAERAFDQRLLDHTT
jgi:5-methylthioadenosine/S-adenosylhomocysteine deaminase